MEEKLCLSENALKVLEKRYLKRDKDGKPTETANDLCLRVASTLANADKQFGASDEEIKKECEWIKNNLGTNTPIHFSAFHPSYKFKNYPITNSKTLLKACDIALKTGLNYVYTGNIQNTGTSSTYCKNCKNIIIKRNGFMVEEFYLDNDGKCIFCKTQCNGDF